MQPKKIVIENTVCLNTGDAAILFALIKIIKNSFGEDTIFSVFDSHPTIASKYYPEVIFYPLITSAIRNNKNFKIAGMSFKKPFPKLWRAFDLFILRKVANQLIKTPNLEKNQLIDPLLFKCLKIYAEADLIISTGGTYLVENYRITDRIEEFKKDIALKKPLVFFTQSLGPFKNKNNIILLKKIFNEAQFILLRDQKSKLHLQEIGVNQNKLSVVADSVFALSLSANQHEYATGTTQKVAVSVREWAHFSHGDTRRGMHDYTSAISNAVIALVRQKKIEVTFLSTCQGIPEYRFDDSKIANQIFESLPHDVQLFVKVDRSFHTPEHLIKEISQFDFVIATRMHMAILSFCAHVPVLPIAYEFKTTELFKELGQEHWITDISTIDTNSFLEKALKFADEFNQIRREILPKILAQAESAKSAGKLILDSLKK